MDNNGSNGQLQPQAQLPSTMLRMEILFDQAAGTCQVNGPIQNLFVCYAMLELAKDACRKYAADQASDKRILAPGITMIPRC